MKYTSTCRRKKKWECFESYFRNPAGDLYEIVVNISKLHYRQMSSIKLKIQIIIYIFLSINRKNNSIQVQNNHILKENLKKKRETLLSNNR